MLKNTNTTLKDINTTTDFMEDSSRSNSGVSKYARVLACFSVSIGE